MATKIQLRRDTSANWTETNPTLSSGEIGFETNTGKFKIGNGSSAWSALDYFLDSSDLSGYLSASSASTTYLTQASASTTYATKAGPTFTGTVILPSTTSIGNVSSTEIGYLDNVSSAIQTQLDNKLETSSASTTYLTQASASTTYLTQASASTTYAKLAPSTNAQTSASYTLVLTDAGKYIEMNNAGANTLTVPLNASVAFPIGTEITVIQTGAGATTIAPAGGVTVNYYSPTTSATRILKSQWAGASLIKRATDTWVLIGNLT
jgi:hypothetical protein